jgi:5'(3')-deoxyribonucleotidase
MKPRLLLDVDTVLANFLKRAIDELNAITGKSYTTADMTEWDIFECFDVSDEVERLVYDRLNQPGVCESLEVLPGAQEGVAMLENVAQIYIVTSPMRGKTWTREREEWLWKHFKIPTKRVIHTSAKYAVSGDYLVDDRPSNVIRWLESHPDAVGVLWKCDPNRHVVELPRNVVHTCDWKQVVDMISNHQHTFRMWKP